MQMMAAKPLTSDSQDYRAMVLQLMQGVASVRRWFPAVLVLDGACYLLVAGFAFFWDAAARLSSGKMGDMGAYGSRVLLCPSVLGEHVASNLLFSVLAPLVLRGVLAYQVVRSSGLGSRVRGWMVFAALLLIQVEWRSISPGRRQASGLSREARCDGYAVMSSVLFPAF